MRYIKKIFHTFLLALSLVLFLIPTAHAQTTPCQSSNTNYCLLAPLPGLPGNGNSVDTTVGIESYINTLIKILIGLMSVLAVIMIVVGGIQYMVSSSGGEKQGGKDRITNALMGLVLALSAYLILNTINPHLVNLHVGVPNASLTENFDSTVSGQDGLGVGATALVGVGNKVKNPTTGDEIIASQASGLADVLYLSHIDYPITCLQHGAPTPVLKLNTHVVDSFVNALNKWCNDRNAMADTNPEKAYRFSTLTGFDGAAAPNGADGKPSLQSAHAFGIAVDIEPAVGVSLPPTLIADFKSFGWGWGGDLSTKDYKHFSKLQEEGGSGSDSYGRE